MARFSDDGQQWWDGANWVPTSQVVIPELVLTGVPDEVLRTAMRYKAFADANAVANSFSESPTPDVLKIVGITLFLTDVVLFRRAFRAFRMLKLAQLNQAAKYLLGPDEPILAAEASVYPSIPVGWVRGELGVVLSEAHVLVLSSEQPFAAPRWVQISAKPTDVQIQFKKRRWLGFMPAIVVRQGRRVWPITGVPGVLQPEPVLDAWRKAVNATAAAR